MRARPFVATGLFRVDAAPAAFNQYVFAWDTDVIVGYTYNDGAYVSTRGEAALVGITPAGSVGSVFLIASDSSATVGDYSLLSSSGSGELVVADIENGVGYSYTPTSIFTNPVYRNGKVYWIEIDGTDAILMEADTDLTNAAESARDAHGVTFASGQRGALGLSGAAFIFDAVVNETGVDRLRMRFPFTGATTTNTFTSSTNFPTGAGLADGSGRMLFVGGDAVTGSTISLCRIDDSASSAITDLWSAVGLGQSVGSVTSTVLSLDTGKTTAQVYWLDDVPDVSDTLGAYRADVATGASVDGEFLIAASPDGVAGQGGTGMTIPFYVGD